MARPLPVTVPHRHAGGQSRLALRFFAVSVGVLLAAALVAALLHRVLGRPVAGAATIFPPAFAATTLLLLAGSFALGRAVRFVRLERQRPFRRWLQGAVVAGTLFLGVQTYALWSLVPAERTAQAASTGVTAFVLMLAGLHGLHMTVAVLFVVLVTLQALADRYDHEYYWGVTCCAWFWHLLGIVWLGILTVCAIAA